MKYSDFVHESEIRHRSISYNILTPKPKKSGDISIKPEKIKICYTIGM